MYLKIIIWEIRLDKLQQDIKQPFLTYPVKWRMYLRYCNFHFTKTFYFLQIHFVLYPLLRRLSSYLMKTENWSHSWLHSHPPVSRQTGKIPPAIPQLSEAAEPCRCWAAAVTQFFGNSCCWKLSFHCNSFAP